MEKDFVTRGKTICLCMIVKNESQVIDRALKSVLPYIDYWVICDTGSTDHTPAVVLQHLYTVPGEIHHIEWVNFGYNRTKAIQLAQNKADYILVMDADMIVNVYGDFKQKLEYDFYEIRYEGEMDYTQPMLVSGKHKWEYIGVTHEYLNAAPGLRSGFLPELTLAHFGDGNNRSEKFERDIRLLESDLEKEPGNRRTVFYLAQSYKDLGKWEAALKYYQERINLGDGWEEELFFSMYQVGKMQQSLGYDWAVVEKSYLAAFSFRPHRLEPVYEVVKYYREKEAFALGYLYSSLVSYSLDYPQQDRLFIDRSVYTYKFLLEHAVCAYAQNKLAEAVETFNKIVDVNNLPQWAMDAAFRGRKMALDIIYNKQESNHPVFNKIKVLIPFYNPGCYFEKCIDSLLAQDYSNFELIFLDDGSADSSYKKIPLADERVTLVRKKKNKGLGYNLHHLYRRYCDPTDIVVHVDADDYLAGPGALSYINRFYNEHDCWVMYGQYQYSCGAPGICKPFASPGDFLRLRLDWRTSHVRSFRAGLYHKIAETDPGYSCMKDAQGQWFSSAADAAVMFPIVELAGFDRVCFNDQVLYIYNEGNANSLTNKNRKAQLNSYLQIEAKRPFRPVDSYLPASVADKIKS